VTSQTLERIARSASKCDYKALSVSRYYETRRGASPLVGGILGNRDEVTFKGFQAGPSLNRRRAI
jgi:hypothetical protein